MNNMNNIDYGPIIEATSEEFGKFIQSTLKEWRVEKFKWRFDPNWAGAVFFHVLVYSENTMEASQLLQFVYHSDRFYVDNVNEDALNWLKDNLS